MQQKHWVSLVITAIIAVATYGQQQGWFDKAAQKAMNNQPGLYNIERYTDGDTVAVDMNGTTETIRFIGIDTPETHKPNTPVQCYGPAAAAYTKNRITAAGGKVRLVADSLSTNRDRYNRLLRYVYLPDGTNLNEEIVKNGYGFYYPYFPFSKKADFDRAQQTAITAKKGLWGNCTPTPTDNGGYKMEQPQG